MDWIHLFSIFIQSGCVCSPIMEESHIIINLSEELTSLLQKININFESDEEHIIIKDTKVVDTLVLTEEGFPEWVWRLDYTQSRDLFERINCVETIFMTQHEKLARDMSILAIHSITDCP